MLEDMLRRHHRRCPVPDVAVALRVQRLFHRQQSSAISDDVIVEQVQTLLAAVAANPASLQSPFWNE